MSVRFAAPDRDLAGAASGTVHFPSMLGSRGLGMPRARGNDASILTWCGQSHREAVIWEGFSPYNIFSRIFKTISGGCVLYSEHISPFL